LNAKLKGDYGNKVEITKIKQLYRFGTGIEVADANKKRVDDLRRRGNSFIKLTL